MCVYKPFFFRGVSFDSAIEIQLMIIPESDKPIIKLQNLQQPEAMEQLSFKSLFNLSSFSVENRC